MITFRFEHRIDQLGHGYGWRLLLNQLEQPIELMDEADVVACLGFISSSLKRHEHDDEREIDALQNIRVVTSLDVRHNALDIVVNPLAFYEQMRNIREEQARKLAESVRPLRGARAYGCRHRRYCPEPR